MLSTQDKLELTELVAGYSLASDRKDVAGHMAYYTEDGFIDGDMTTSKKNENMAEDLAGIFAMEGTLKRHLAMNFMFAGDENKAIVDYLLLVIEGETMPAVMATSVIQDEMVKVDDEWKVKRHHIKVDPAMFNMMKQWEEQQSHSQ